MFAPGSTALVTGASGGIGEQFARQLAARNLNVVVAARNSLRLRELAGELEQAHPGISVTVLPTDLSETVAPERLVRALAAAGTTVDVLINNAGIGSHARLVEEDPEAVLREIQLNCVSLVALTRALLPGMLDRGSGGVLNVASTAGFQPIPTMAVYGASKAFVLSFTKAVWAETKSSGGAGRGVVPRSHRDEVLRHRRRRQAIPHPWSAEPRTGRRFRTACVGDRPRPIGHSGREQPLLASGYRFVPRSVMVRMAERNVRAT